jgi:predicted nucleic acid-binding protein
MPSTGAWTDGRLGCGPGMRGSVLAAIDIHQRTGASFWDAMILRSAKELRCGTLHSEDLNPGQAYEGVQVRNPFLA